MARGRKHFPLRYRRARSVLYGVGLFWLWLWFGSAASLEGLHHSPLHAVLAMYALAVAILVSIPAAVLAAAQMILARPRSHSAVILKLPVAPQRPPLVGTQWQYGEKAS